MNFKNQKDFNTQLYRSIFDNNCEMLSIIKV